MSAFLIQHLPAPPNGRVETGPVQFGDDWPGAFIRGDSAAWWAFCLRQLITEVPPAERVSLLGLLDALEGCDVTRRPRQ